MREKSNGYCLIEVGSFFKRVFWDLWEICDY